MPASGRGTNCPRGTGGTAGAPAGPPGGVTGGWDWVESAFGFPPPNAAHAMPTTATSARHAAPIMIACLRCGGGAGLRDFFVRDLFVGEWPARIVSRAVTRSLWVS